MIITFTREELRDMLQVQENTLKAVIKRKQLEQRINEVGYKLHNTYKQGRNTIYELVPLDEDYWKEIQSKYNIRKKKEQTAYSYIRINRPEETRAGVIRSSHVNISNNTAKKFDTILVLEGGLMYNEEQYMLIDINNNTMTPIDKKQYCDFWIEHKKDKAKINEIEKKIERGDITKETGDLARYKVQKNLYKDGFIAVRFDTFKQAENAQKLLNDIRKHCKINKKIS